MYMYIHEGIMYMHASIGLNPLRIKSSAGAPAGLSLGQIPA